MSTSCIPSFVKIHPVVLEKKSKMWKVYAGRTDRRTDGRTDDGRCAMTIAHLSLRLRWAKQEAERATYRAPEYNVPPFWQISKGHKFCLLIGLKKHKLGRRLWDLASCQVSLNSIQRIQKKSWKCLSQSDARMAILFFRSAQKHNLVENIEILPPVKFSWMPFGGFGGEVENVLANHWGQGGHLVFPIGPKKTNLVKDVEILIPVKFRWIPFSGFREEVSAIQTPGRPSCVFDRPE